jgi:hypothetical protein
VVLTKWGDQDGGLGGVGTVLGNDGTGWVRVQWDRKDTANSYRMGKDCCYDLKLTGGSSEVSADKDVSKGDRVVRGPNWKWGDQDGGLGGVGTVLGNDETGWVRDFYHPGTREHKGGCVGECCDCQAPCGGGCGSGSCSGDCRWTCCGKTGRKSSWSGCTHAGSTSTSDTTLKKIVKDTHVQLTKDYKDHGDASKGPLKSGEVGVVIADDGSSKPFHVRAANGKEWW